MFEYLYVSLLPATGDVLYMYSALLNDLPHLCVLCIKFLITFTYASAKLGNVDCLLCVRAPEIRNPV